MIQIWLDPADSPLPSHFWIQIGVGEKIHHYFHWDSLLNWHDSEIARAQRVVIHISQFAVD